MNNNLIRAVQRLSDILPNSKFILLNLCFYTSATSVRVWPSITQMRKDTGLSDKTVRRLIKDLKDKKLIIDTGDRKGRTGSVVVYEISIDMITKLSSPVTDTALSPVTDTAVRVGSPVTVSREARSLVPRSPVTVSTHSIYGPIQRTSDDDQSRAWARETSSNFDQEESCTPPSSKPASPKPKTYRERCTEIYHTHPNPPDYTLEDFLRHCDFLRQTVPDTQPGKIHAMLTANTFEIPGKDTRTVRREKLRERAAYCAAIREKDPDLDAALRVMERNFTFGRYETPLTYAMWAKLVPEEREKAHYPYPTYQFEENVAQKPSDLPEEKLEQLALEAKKRKAQEEKIIQLDAARKEAAKIQHQKYLEHKLKKLREDAESAENDHG